MPNMVLVGGLNCHVRNPLPEVSNYFKMFTFKHILNNLSDQMLVLLLKKSTRQHNQPPFCLKDLTEWVSGDHGFIVFTLGTAISDMPEETTSVFLDAFRQIPQKVQGSTTH